MQSAVDNVWNVFSVYGSQYILYMPLFFVSLCIKIEYYSADFTFICEKIRI